MATTKKPDDKTPGFDDLLTELDGVVERLEQGELPLEEALERFERGVNLARQAERILGQAEKRVEVLLSTKEGDVLAPLDAPDRGTGDER
jgi:exodeoxyribonuclease VII small subunit